MKGILSLLNSRKFAVYLLSALLAVLVISAFFPNQFTVSAEKWRQIEEESPFIYGISTKVSTPYIVQNPLFALASVFLFLSTLVCTTSRLTRWMRIRKSEFEKEKVFSFSSFVTTSEAVGDLRSALEGHFRRRGWWHSVSEIEGRVEIEAQKGGKTGFWGSVVFHTGLLICFIAAPVTAYTVFRGKFVASEGVPVSLSEGMVFQEGKPLSSLPEAKVTLYDLKGVYEKGIYDVEFGGMMKIEEGGSARDISFGVNRPASYGGYQLSLKEFGFSPHIVVEKEGKAVFDYTLNLFGPAEGDYFELPSEGLRMFALFFPDFEMEGKRLVSRSKEPKNPVLLIRLLRGDDEISKGLLMPGGEEEIGGYRVKFTGLGHWAGLIVVKETGVSFIIAGFVIGTIGLFVRFMGNERRLEIVLEPSEGGTKAAIRGYSRYYPAFLEKEVTETAGRLGA